MSVFAVSSNSLHQIQQYFHTRQTDLKQLGQALASGDLAGAQAAFQNIAKLGQSGPFANGDPFAVKQREQDFTAIGKALAAGDLAGAQQAFSDLKATFQKGSASQVPPNPVPKPPVSSSGSPEIILNLSNNSTSTSPEQITINISNPASGGEQISLSVGSQGSKPQECTFNLPANSNEQIVLNLLGASAAASGSSGSGSVTPPTAPPTVPPTAPPTAPPTTAASSASGGLSISA